MADDARHNQTEYAPTEAEEKLLEVLLDPDHRHKKKAELCRLAGICRQTYYDAFAKPEFVALYEERTKALVRPAIAPIINAYIKEAVGGSIQHGNVLLDMAGIYTPRSRTELTGKDGGAIEYSSILPQDEVNRRLAEMGLLPQPAEKGEKPEDKPN